MSFLFHICCVLRHIIIRSCVFCFFSILLLNSQNLSCCNACVQKAWAEDGCYKSSQRDVSKGLSGTILRSTTFYHLTSIRIIKEYVATILCRPMLGEANTCFLWICYASNAQYFHNHAGQEYLLCSTISDDENARKNGHSSELNEI